MEQLKRCEGNGLGSCKSCESKGKWNRQWMCFLYEIDGMDGCYCLDCAKEIIHKKCKCELSSAYGTNCRE